MAKILKNLNQKMVLVYCFGYVLKLSVSDFINKVTNLDELGSLNQYKGVLAFCFFVSSHNQLITLSNWSLDVLKDNELKTRVNGVTSQMGKFEFVFCFLLGEKVLKQTDNLSRTLQVPTTSASQGNRLVFKSFMYFIVLETTICRCLYSCFSAVLTFLRTAFLQNTSGCSLYAFKSDKNFEISAFFFAHKKYLFASLFPISYF